MSKLNRVSVFLFAASLLCGCATPTGTSQSVSSVYESSSSTDSPHSIFSSTEESGSNDSSVISSSEEPSSSESSSLFSSESSEESVWSSDISSESSEEPFWSSDISSESEHHYSSKWSHDDVYHWHNCVDEGFSDLKADLEKRTFSDELIEIPATDFSYTVTHFALKKCPDLTITSETGTSDGGVYQNSFALGKTFETKNWGRIKELHFPSSIKAFESFSSPYYEDRVFFHLNRIESIYYEGTVEQWYALGFHYDYDCYKKLGVVHCSDGEASLF